jgi:hypothetical protein
MLSVEKSRAEANISFTHDLWSHTLGKGLFLFIILSATLDADSGKYAFLWILFRSLES